MSATTNTTTNYNLRVENDAQSLCVHALDGPPASLVQDDLCLATLLMSVLSASRRRFVFWKAAELRRTSLSCVSRSKLERIRDLRIICQLVAWACCSTKSSHRRRLSRVARRRLRTIGLVSPTNQCESKQHQQAGRKTS